MKKCNHIGKISLVIAYKKHILFWKLTDIFSTGDLKLIYDCQARIRKNANNGIYNRSKRFDMFELLYKAGHEAVNIFLKLRICEQTTPWPGLTSLR